MQMYYEIFKCMEKTGGTEWFTESIWVDNEQTENDIREGCPPAHLTEYEVLVNECCRNTSQLKS